MKEPNELTDQDRETLRKVESLLASPHSASADADDVSVLLANAMPQADDAFRRQLDARLMEKLEKKQARTLQQNGRALSQTPDPPIVLTQPARGPVRMFNRVTGGLGSALVAAMLVAALALATIFLWQSQRNVPPADKNGTPISILDPAPADDCGQGWIVNNSYQDVLPNALRAVSAAVIGPNDVWLVGAMSNGDESTMVTAHWDGFMWDVMSLAEPGTLNAVAAVSPDDVWAVGGSKTFHWDGTKWNARPIPAPEDDRAISATNLYGVAAVSANDVWAVGSYPINRREDRKVILHWDGVKWSAVETPKPSESSHLSAVTALSSNDVWSVGSVGISGLRTSSSPLIMHWDGKQWSAVEVPSAAGRGVLTAIAAQSANDIWAVGWSSKLESGSSPLIIHWDGQHWSVRANDELPRSRLWSVTTVSANDVWAVGEATQPDKTSGIVMRWNGTVWREIPIPDLQSAGADQLLHAIAASPSGDIWAVGRGSTSTGASPLVLRYGKLPCPTKTPSIVAPPGLECGPRWTVSSSPDLIASDNSFKSVAAIAPDNVWAVGKTAWNGALAMRWNGRQWNVVPTPDKVRALWAVAGVASNDVWAVGDGEALHWDGTKWNIVPMPTPEGSEGHSLYGIEAIAANDVWAVGYHAKSGAGSLPLIEHWDGTQWRVIPNPAPNIEWAKAMQLRAVSAVSRDDVWAVGDYLDGGSTSGLLIMHWDGKQWSLSQTPQELNGSLLGVAAVSANDVWAVGVASNKAPDSDSGQTRALIMHWDGSQWSVMPEPNIPGEKYLSGVAAVSANDVWAVGTSYNVENGGGITLHWDGSQWSAPAEDKQATFLAGVAALPSGELWAAGGGVGDSGRTGPIVLRYGNAPCATKVPTRVPTSVPVLPTSGTPVLDTPYATSSTASNTPTGTLTPKSHPMVQPSPSAGCGLGWSLVPSGSQGVLQDVAAVSNDDVWAVGHTSVWPVGYEEGKHPPSRTLIQHWDGERWRIVPSPNVGESDNRLYAVTALSSSNVWVVGQYGTSNALKTLTMHWDGIEWKVVVSPDVGRQNELYDVLAISPDDVWAAGRYYTACGNSLCNAEALILHWNGERWSQFSDSSLKVGHSSLHALGATSKNDVWAVGSYSDAVPTASSPARPLFMRWKGTAWVSTIAPVSLPGTLSGIAAISSDDAWAIGYSNRGGEPEGETLIFHWDGFAWLEVIGSRMQLGTGEGLRAIAATATDDVWAVGGGPEPFIQHWDGKAWRLMAVPRNGDSVMGGLFGVVPISPREVWAVGGQDSPASPVRDQESRIMRFADVPCPTHTALPTLSPSAVGDCTPRWRVVDSPNPSTQSNELNAVAVISANDIWAVGTSADRALTLHWNGKEWRVVPAPGLRFDKIAAVATDDVWAIGIGSVAHWDGTVWKEVSIPTPGGSKEPPVLQGIAAVSTNDIWAVGYYQSYDGDQFLGELTLTLHWNGKEWRVIPSPNITSKVGSTMNALLSVSAVSRNDVWAVGTSAGGPLAIHWNGKEWSLVPVPRTQDNDYLSSVVATASNDVWAGGTSETSSEPNRFSRKVRSFIIHWDGAKWSLMPGIELGHGGLGDIVVISKNDAWAVGWSSDHAGEARTVMMHWDGKQWTVVPSPNPGEFLNFLRGIEAAPDGEVWAVGSALSMTLVLRYDRSPCTTPTTIPKP